MAKVTLSKPLDDDSIPKREFKPLPIGVYFGFIKEAKVQFSKNAEMRGDKKPDRFVLIVELSGNEEFDGKLIFPGFQINHEVGLSKLGEAMVKLGLPIKSVQEIDTDDFESLPCKFKTKQKPYDGKMRDELHYFIELNEAERLALNPVAAIGKIDLGDDIPF